MFDPDDFRLWERVLGASWAKLTSAESKCILRMRFSTVDLKKIDTLGKRAQSGQLNDETRAELDRYLAMGRLLSLLKARARLAKRSGSKVVSSRRKGRDRVVAATGACPGERPLRILSNPRTI